MFLYCNQVDFHINSRDFNGIYLVAMYSDPQKNCNTVATLSVSYKPPVSQLFLFHLV